eukprot:scaffold55069_cov69-Phaeocystis_antarctica.AAC.1
MTRGPSGGTLAGVLASSNDSSTGGAARLTVTMKVPSAARSIPLVCSGEVQVSSPTCVRAAYA